MGNEEDLQRLMLFIEKSGGVELAARQLDVWPSTLRKLIAGGHISAPTRAKLNPILGDQSGEKQQPNYRLDIVTTAIREAIKIPADIVESASKFNVKPSTIMKILEGKPISYSVQEKLFATVYNPLPVVADSKSVYRKSMVDRLKYTHQLYKELGTLNAAGKVMGVTRERVRQLLVKGSQLGLFEYKPFDYPFVSKDTLLRDYRKYLSLGRVAKANGISSTYLRKLLTAYRITEAQLHALWDEGQKIHCITAYNTIKEHLGYHPTTTVLQGTRPWRYLSMKITRLWGSFDAFRQELSIPTPPKGNPSFSESTRRWRETRQRLGLIVRLQHLDRIRECLDSSRSLSANEIAYECELALQRTLFLLKLLMATGEVIREGQAASTKYLLAKG